MYDDNGAVLPSSQLANESALTGTDAGNRLPVRDAGLSHGHFHVHLATEPLNRHLEM